MVFKACIFNCDFCVEKSQSSILMLFSFTFYLNSWKKKKNRLPWIIFSHVPDTHFWTTFVCLPFCYKMILFLWWFFSRKSATTQKNLMGFSSILSFLICGTFNRSTIAKRKTHFMSFSSLCFEFKVIFFFQFLV